ncbi:hypothetical protein GCM10023083_57250 [Streptomyces phyllanthi]
MDRQPEVPQTLGERFGDRLVVLDEQHSYAHAFPSLREPSTAARHRDSRNSVAVELTRYKSGQWRVAQIRANVRSRSKTDPDPRP